jgi:DNA-binding winged helix-turn-helix (wHTH) protein
MATSTSASKRVSIGPFVFDAERRLLVARGGAVALSLLEYELLALLAARRPRAVSKGDIQDALWPRTSVAETSLTTLVRDLRLKLRQKGRDGPIRTVHGFGYALESPADPAAPAPRLLRGRSEIRIVSPELVIGREPGHPGSIDDASVSRRHARIAWNGSGAVLTDLGSKNGTYVRGKRIAEPVALKDGDELRIGLVTFTYRAAPAAASTTKTVG